MIRAEKGAATVVGLALIGVLTSIAIACSLVAAAVVTHRRAQAAADLAALAAAQALQGGSDACSAARRVARANGAAVRGCHTDRWDVLVSVGVPVSGSAARLLGARAELFARARAGPEDRGLEPNGG